MSNFDNFTPVYEQVAVFGPPYIFKADGSVSFTTNPVNPVYCLSAASAKQFAALLEPELNGVKVTVTSGDPTPFDFQSPFHYTKQVAWLHFDDVANQHTYDSNAGLLAGYFQQPDGQRPTDSNTALLNVKADIAAGLVYAG